MRDDLLSALFRFLRIPGVVEDKQASAKLDAIPQRVSDPEIVDPTDSHDLNPVSQAMLAGSQPSNLLAATGGTLAVPYYTQPLGLPIRQLDGSPPRLDGDAPIEMALDERQAFMVGRLTPDFVPGPFTKPFNFGTPGFVHPDYSLLGPPPDDDHA